MKQVELVDVKLWDRKVGAVAWDSKRGVGTFEYEKSFLSSGIELSPITMPLNSRIYSFPHLSEKTYHGLPGMLADSLPDKFGNLLIDRWLVRNGRVSSTFSPIERLCYTGSRGMGALEFYPSLQQTRVSVPVEISDLLKLANSVLQQRTSIKGRLSDNELESAEMLQDILRVGTSAGGARAKAVVAWNKKTGEMRSGQVKAPDDFGYWLLKFDGVNGNSDKELSDPVGFGKVEYAYYLMARQAGIDISESRLFEENGRSHFMTKRFDRGEDGQKIFMQSLCGLAHYDFNMARAFSYEQAMLVADQIGLPKTALLSLFRRATFNILARNQDDHTKNIAFLMNQQGRWRLAPAYDLTFSYNPNGAWTSSHQMSFNGKVDFFSIEDFKQVAKRFNIRWSDAQQVIEKTQAAVEQWSAIAMAFGVEEPWVDSIRKCHRKVL